MDDRASLFFKCTNDLKNDYPAIFPFRQSSAYRKIFIPTFTA
jgi:hypothetical protein